MAREAPRNPARSRSDRNASRLWLFFARRFVSTTSRILLGFLLFLATGLYFLVKKVSERVERQYLEAAEESMVDVAQLMAAFAGESVNEAGTFDLAMIRKAWSVAGTQPVRAQI